MINRDIYQTLESEIATPEVIVITGMRRVGKTTAARHIYDQIHNCRKLFLDLEDPLNQAIFDQTSYEAIHLALERQAVGVGQRFIVFLDEIQNCRQLPSAVKYLLDHHQTKFFLTGSASFYLKNLFTESLAGRKRITEMFPLNFREFLSFSAPSLKLPTIGDEVNEVTHRIFQACWEDFLTTGGFPGVVTQSSPEEKMSALDDIRSSYFQKEVRIISDFRKISAFRDTMTLLTSRIGSKLDVSKLSAELGITRITILEYLDFLEGTYFLSLLNPYSRRTDVVIRGQKKPYLCDVGLLGSGISFGSKLENAVFNLLHQKYDQIFYYQSRGGAEIDFITQKDNRRIAWEVKTHAHPSDAKRLEKQAEKLKLDAFHLVSHEFTPGPHITYPFQL